MKLGEIRRADIQCYVTQRSGVVSAGTVGRELNILKRFFSLVLNGNWSKKEIAYLCEQEVDAFFRMILSPRHKALFRLMYHHGLRASEPGKLMLYDFRPGPGKPRLRVVRLKDSVSGVEHTLLDLELAALKRKAAHPWHGTRPAVQLAQARATWPPSDRQTDEALLHPGGQRIRMP